MNNMHRLYLGIISLVTVVVVAFVVYEVFNTGSNSEVLSSSSRVSEAAEVFNELKEYPYYEPPLLSLEIPNQDISILEVENIGLESDGQLQTPSTWSTAGWYVASAKPGQQGMVVIDGHYDTDTGQPAAFWELKNINLSDKVSLQDERGRTFTYKVSDIFFVDIQDPQRKQVFQESGKAELVLITCGGVWDPVENTYNKRLVVKAELL